MSYKFKMLNYIIKVFNQIKFYKNNHKFVIVILL